MPDRTTPPCSILIVEDEAIGAMYLRRTLERMGHRVVGIEECGETAIATALAERPDLVLMDIRLKGDMDGVTAARRLWQEAAIPSVFITAYGPAELYGRYRLPRDVPVIGKPVPEAALRAAIERITKPRRSPTPAD